MFGTVGDFEAGVWSCPLRSTEEDDSGFRFELGEQDVIEVVGSIVEAAEQARCEDLNLRNLIYRPWVIIVAREGDAGSTMRR